jgi:AcrR family transcriptional regulator
MPGAKKKPTPRPLAMELSTKEQLVLTAERLFAVHGLDGVSLRQISTEAGNANNSAVQYHFGSKERLIQAIFEYRIPALARRRRILQMERPADTLRAGVEWYLLPILEEAEDSESYYLAFLLQIQQYGLALHPYDNLPSEFKKPWRDWARQIDGFLGNVPKPLRLTRITHALTICVHMAADRQLARRHGAPVFPYALHVAEVIDGIVGFLEAPTSQATLDAMPTTPITRGSRVIVP